MNSARTDTIVSQRVTVTQGAGQDPAGRGGGCSVCV